MDNGIIGLKIFGAKETQIKNKIISLWREHYIDTKYIYEIQTPHIVPLNDIRKLGYIDNFTECIVECPKKIYSVKNILQEHCVDYYKMSIKQIENYIKKNNLISDKNFKVILKNKLYAVSSSEQNDSGIDFLRVNHSHGIFKYFAEINKSECFINVGICEIGTVYDKLHCINNQKEQRELTTCEIYYFLEDLDNKYLVTLNPNRKKFILEDDKLITQNISNDKYDIFLCYITIFMSKLNFSNFRFRKGSLHELPHNAITMWIGELLVDNDWKIFYKLIDHSTYNSMLTNLDVNIISKNKYEIERYYIKPCHIKIKERYPHIFSDIINRLNIMEEHELKQYHNNDMIILYLNNNVPCIISNDMYIIEKRKENINSMSLNPYIISEILLLDILL